MSLARQNKGPRKDGPPHGQGSPTQQRRGGGPGPAWRGPQNNPSIMQNFSPPPMTSPGSHSPGLPTNGISNGPNNGTNANDANGAGKNAVPSPNVSLPPAHVTGSLIVVTTRSGSRHEGILSAHGEALHGVSLTNARDLVNPMAPPIPSLFIPAGQISHWRRPDPAPAPSANGPKALDSFRTDTDISGAANGPRERELRAWQPEGSSSAGAPDHNGVNRDNQTFGLNQPNGQWDQFAANEKLFGVTTDFNEEIYTTKLDRNTTDFKERERKAQQLANEIQGSFTANPHLREERNLGGDDSTTNEEDKYGAVVRGAGAYVPPGARRTDSNSSQPLKPLAAPTSPNATNVPKLSVNGPDGAMGGVQGIAAKATTATPTNGQPAPEANAPQGGRDGVENAAASFRDFVSTEKQKMVQKKQAIAKNEKEKRLADLIKFSTSFKLNKPIPADLVTILAKDETKQKAIVEKSAKDAGDVKARAIGQNHPTTAATAVDPSKQAGAGVATKPPANRSSVLQPIPPFKGGVAAKPSPDAAKPSTAAGGITATQSMPKVADKDGASTMASKRIQMSIPKIPPFDPSKRRVVTNGADNASANGGGTGSGATTTTPASPTNAVAPAVRLNANASSFKPNPNASAFKPGSSASSSTSPSAKPAAAETAAPPNPYFGTRQIKKGATVHIKDDFNPFKYAKVAEASAVPANWPFTGKRYLQVFPAVPHPPQPPQHMPVGPQPPTYEEDSAAQQQQVAQRMYPQAMMVYNPYMQYAGAPPPQPHMMAAPNNMGPPGPYMASPYMQPMQYPQGMPPNGAPSMYGPPQMNGMPPAQYLPPPQQQQQGGYQPNGGPRGSMPPTPIPQHAYAAYHHHSSPQMAHQHPLPYTMMMPPPGQGGPPHGYEGQQPGPGMGVGH